MKFLRLSAVLLLAFLGLTAIAGSIPMLLYPEGNEILLPLSLLQYSPFTSYRIPGILLLTTNGVLALVVLWLVIARRPFYGEWTCFQGCVLLGWLAIECILLRMVMWLHYVYGAAGVALVVAGILLSRRERRAANAH